jgi:hypothetical protein
MKKGMNVRFWWEIQKERYHKKDLDMGGGSGNFYVAAQLAAYLEGLSSSGVSYLSA